MTNPRRVGKRPPSKELASLIRKRRWALNMSTLELAFYAEISRGYINQIEMCHVRPSDDVMARLCEAVGINKATMHELMEVEG